MFVDEHCSYCKEILPLWNEVAEVLCKDSTYKIGTVYLESNKDLQYQFNIDTSLVFKLIKNNRVYTFDISYPVQDLMHFAKHSHTLLDGESVPSPKGSFSKLYFVIGRTIDAMMVIFDDIGIQMYPKFIKIILLILIIFSPFLLAMLLFTKLRLNDNEGKENERIEPEVLKLMKLESKNTKMKRFDPNLNYNLEKAFEENTKKFDIYNKQEIIEYKKTPSRFNEEEKRKNAPNKDMFGNIRENKIWKRNEGSNNSFNMDKYESRELRHSETFKIKETKGEANKGEVNSKAEIDEYCKDLIRDRNFIRSVTLGGNSYSIVAASRLAEILKSCPKLAVLYLLILVFEHK